MPGDSGKKDSLKAGEMLGLVLKNRNLMLLFLTDVTRILSMLVMYAMFPYFFKYVVHDINGAAPFSEWSIFWLLWGQAACPLSQDFYRNETLISPEILYWQRE